MNQRRLKRTRTLLQGCVVFNNRFSLINCTVRDLSETGAQIAFPHPVEIPRELELEVPKKGLSVRARVMWSNGKSHGLAFVQEEKHNSPALLLQQDAKDKSRPDMDKQQGAGEAGIQDVLEEARKRIATIAKVPAEKVRLKLEIDF